MPTQVQPRRRPWSTTWIADEKTLIASIQELACCGGGLPMQDHVERVGLGWELARVYKYPCWCSSQLRLSP